jgi:hypothetical protein
MAYDGPISYMAVPFGQALWLDDITSPFAKAGEPDVPGGRQAESDNSLAMTSLELEAPVWDLVGTQHAEVVLDNERQNFRQPLQCVVVGMSKGASLNEQQAYYVLLVAHLAPGVNGGQVYERIGVGILNLHHIAFDGPRRLARIG